MPTTIITGAARGIGRAIAVLFAQNHYQVLLNYHRSQDEARALTAKLQAHGYRVAAFQADVSNSAQVTAMIDDCVTRFGAIDLLINNAGIGHTALLTETTETDWDRINAVNLKGVFLCSQAVLKSMLARKKGKIINIASIWGMVGASCEVAYSAAKAGVIGLTKALAKEVGPSNIQVNCIAPGVITTKMLADYTETELQDLRDQTPLGRLGSPAEIAACALFLASPAANFITGQVISPNGGFVIS
ncbi:MAG: 3-oxoacyl-ACP reductase FabG [Bacillota bacterium]|jgi:3-oxoacyl-[acyl-carrier protein] reductase